MSEENAKFQEMLARVRMDIERLAVSILRDHFGQRVFTIGVIMIATGGAQTLSQITEASGMEKQNAREALLTLMHHNIVSYETKTRSIHLPALSTSSSSSSSSSVLVEEQTVVKKKYFYKIDVEKIVERMRFARYVLQARSMFGHKEELVMECVLQLGRATVDELVSSVTKACAHSHLASKSMEGSSLKGEILAAIRTLANANYITPLRPPSSSGLPTPSPASSTPASSTSSTPEPKKRGRKRKAEETPTRTTKRRKSSGTAPEKSILAATPATESLPDDQQTFLSNLSGCLWMCNSTQILVDLRENACVRLVEEKFDASAAKIIRALFLLAKEKKLSPQTGFVAGEAILQQLRADGTELTPETFQNYLEIFQQGSLKVLLHTPSPDGGIGLFSIDILRLTSLMAQKSVESILFDRYGQESLRIFRMVLAKKHAEEKQVADETMVPIKKTREKLYKLFHSEFLYLQEIPKGERIPSRTLYLYSIDLGKVIQKLTNDTYRTCANLYARAKFERDSNPDLAEYDEDEEFGREGEEGEGEGPGGEMGGRWRAYQGRQMRIESSLHSLSSLVLSLTQFQNE